MEKNLSTSNFKKKFFKKVPKGFLCFVVLVFTVESVVYFFFKDKTTNATVASVFALRQIAQKTKKDYDVIILGDSTAHGDIQAKEFESLTGYKTFNFSTSGNTVFIGAYDLLDTYLKNHKPPRYIIVMAAHDVWTRGLDTPHVFDSVTYNFTKDALKTLLKIYLWDPPYRDIVRNFFGQLTPSMVYKYDILRLFKAGSPRQYIRLRERMVAHEIVRFQKLNGSTLYEHIKPAGVIDDLRNQLKNASEGFKFSRFNRFYFDHIVALAQKYNTKILICHPPVFEAFDQYAEGENVSRSL